MATITLHSRCETGAWRFRSIMMTSSNGNIFRVTGYFCGNLPITCEFPAQRPVTRSFDVFFDLRPNKHLSKQWRCWWFETSSHLLWRHSNVNIYHYQQSMFQSRRLATRVISVHPHGMSFVNVKSLKLLHCVLHTPDITQATKNLQHIASQWASHQICKIAGCACAGNTENVFPAIDFKGNH